MLPSPTHSAFRAARLSCKPSRVGCVVLREQKVKRELEKARELEGIDSSNIISDGARPRRAAAKPVDYG